MAQAETCRAMIVKLFQAGVFNVKRGKAVLSFDHEGKLGSIEITEMRYRAGDLLTGNNSGTISLT